MSKVLIFNKNYRGYFSGGNGLVDKASAHHYERDEAQEIVGQYLNNNLVIEEIEDKVLIVNSRGGYWAARGHGLAEDRARAHHYDRSVAESLTELMSTLKIEEIDTRPLAEQLAGAREVLAAMDAIVAGLRAEIADFKIVVEAQGELNDRLHAHNDVLSVRVKAADALADDLRESSRRFHRERQKADAKITRFGDALADPLEAA